MHLIERLHDDWPQRHLLLWRMISCKPYGSQSSLMWLKLTATMLGEDSKTGCHVQDPWLHALPWTAPAAFRTEYQLCTDIHFIHNSSRIKLFGKEMLLIRNGNAAVNGVLNECIASASVQHVSFWWPPTVTLWIFLFKCWNRSSFNMLAATFD